MILTTSPKTTATAERGLLEAPPETQEAKAAERPTSITAEGAPSGVVDIRELLEYQQSNLQRDIQEIAAFFGIEQSGADMARLTGVNTSSLSRALRGDVQASRLRPHIAVLAAFARASREALSAYLPQGASLNQEGMQAWLYSGSVRTLHGIMAPIEALAQHDLAREALAEMRRAEVGAPAEEDERERALRRRRVARRFPETRSVATGQRHGSAMLPDAS